MKILITAPYMQPVLEEFRPLFEAADPKIKLVSPPVNERMSEDELLEWIGDIDGVVSGDDAFTERVMKAAPKLKVISKWGTGIDSIDQEAAGRLGIAVRNTPDAFTDAVADTVLGYALCFARQLPWMDSDIRSGNWSKRSGFALKESTMGIFGIGNVGKAVVKRASAFGMRVIGHDPLSVSDTFLNETGLQMVSKEDLLRQSDFVTLNCDLNSASHHLIGQSELTAMKSTAYLINSARGPLVDEQALVIALETGEISGAALDVFEEEPLPDSSGLRKLDNCLMAPHNANSSPEAYQRVHVNTIRNLLAVLQPEGGPATG
jgi:D-3-phosphoglycerate dehydrogenase